MRRHLILGAVVLIGLIGYAEDLFADDKEAIKAFDTVQKVFQSPRCQNCHIPGDSPLQFDAGIPHAMNVVRGMDGKGAAGFALRYLPRREQSAGQLRRSRTAGGAALEPAAGRAQNGLDRSAGRQVVRNDQGPLQQRRPRFRRADQACQRRQTGALGLESGSGKGAGAGAARHFRHPVQALG